VLRHHGAVSKYFKVDEQVLWNPSNGVAKLFVSTAQALVALADEPHGLHDTGSDECEIDPVLFEAFIDALVRRYLASSHLILRSHMEGFLATALVLVERAGGTVRAFSEPKDLDMRDLSVGTVAVNARGDADQLRDMAAAHAKAMRS
jgi:hypothetical protein